MNARSVVFSIAAFALATVALHGVQAQEYPTKPIRLLVPFAPGGGNDTLARIFGQKLTESWGRQVIIDNRPGAGTTIATAVAARAAPDGYTLLLSSIASHAVRSRTRPCCIGRSPLAARA